jgi:2-phospho-L-lactate/phosphoenolpyruvate guanylyltransferase
VNCWAIIPVKPPEQAKSRLAEVLDAGEREALASAMLAHVVGAALAADHVQQVALLGPSRLGMAEELPLLADPGTGLNPALHAALAEVSGQGADRLIILFADLPQLKVQDIQLLACAPAGTVAIAPDRHGTGTNALSLPLPAAQGFTFAFGPDSFAAHNTEAERLGLRIEAIHSHGLARDVDVPEDLADAAGLMGPSV